MGLIKSCIWDMIGCRRCSRICEQVHELTRGGDQSDQIFAGPRT